MAQPAGIVSASIANIGTVIRCLILIIVLSFRWIRSRCVPANADAFARRHENARVNSTATIRASQGARHLTALSIDDRAAARDFVPAGSRGQKDAAGGRRAANDWFG
jgi:hypothetical protein